MPRRRFVPGSRPGITGEDPMSRDMGDQEQWCFPALGNGLTEQEKRLVMAKVMRTAVLAIFKTHTYHFGEKYYLQELGSDLHAPLLGWSCCGGMTS